MLIRLLPTALLFAGLSAQTVLVYDNGPFETAPGVSLLQNNAVTLGGLGHTVYGYGGQKSATINNSCFDQFVVSTAMIVEEVEYYTYQTGGGSGPSTITGGFIAFYDSDPSTQQPLAEMTGSPLIANDMFATPNNPVANVWSGVYRDLQSSPGSQTRAIMRVRVRLEDASGTATPLILLPGTYWLQVQASGSLASGPWLPPIAVTGQGVTGDAMQKVTAGTFNNPIVSGTDPQGIPFKLFGPASSIPGSITQVATGCGGTGITVEGAPNMGGFIRTTLTPSNPAAGIPIIGYDFGATPTAFCNCTAIHTFPIALWFATTTEIQIPLAVGFAGLQIGVQGAEFLGTGGGCANPPVNFTDGYLVTVNI